MTDAAQKVARFWGWVVGGLVIAAGILIGLGAERQRITGQVQLNTESNKDSHAALDSHYDDHDTEAVDEVAHRKEVNDSLHRVEIEQSEAKVDRAWMKDTLKDIHSALKDSP